MHTVQFLMVFPFSSACAVLCTCCCSCSCSCCCCCCRCFWKPPYSYMQFLCSSGIFHFSASAGVIVCRLCVFLERRLYSQENRVSLEEPLQNLCVCSVSLILWRIPPSSGPLSLGFSVQAACKCSQRKIKTCSHAHDANCFVIVASIAPSDSVFRHSPTMKCFFSEYWMAISGS